MTVNTDIECVLPRPDISELSEAVRTELSKRLLGGAPVLPLSSEDILSFVMAGTINLAHGFVTQALREQDPKWMCCDNLITYAARRGINLLGATRAKGYVAITGDPDAGIPANIRFIGEASREYKLDPGVNFNPITLGSGGGAVLRIVATLPGAIFNLTPGRTLDISTVTPGIDYEATVVGNGLTGGTDMETCEELRKRVIMAEAHEIIALNEAWYLQQALRYPGVTRACTDACQGCCDPTYIAIYPFMEGVYGDAKHAPYGVPPCEVLFEMTDWMFGREPGRGQGLAPVGIRGAFQQAMPTKINIVANCTDICPIGAEDRVREAVWEYFRYTLCVGSTICKDQLRTVIYKALGPDACLSNVRFTYYDGVRYEDDANIHLDCGRFAIAGDLILFPYACGPIEPVSTLGICPQPMPAACTSPALPATVPNQSGPDVPAIACWAQEGCCLPSPCALDQWAFLCLIRSLLPEGDIYNNTRAWAKDPPRNVGVILVGCARVGCEQLIFGGCCNDQIFCDDEPVAPQLAVVDAYAAVAYGVILALCAMLRELDPCTAVYTLRDWARRHGLISDNLCDRQWPDDILRFLLCWLPTLKGTTLNWEGLQMVAARLGASIVLRAAGDFSECAPAGWWTMARDRPECPPTGGPADPCWPGPGPLPPACPPEAYRIAPPWIRLVPQCETPPESLNLIICPSDIVIPDNCNLPGTGITLPHDPEMYQLFKEYLLPRILPQPFFWCVYDCDPANCIQ